MKKKDGKGFVRVVRIEKAAAALIFMALMFIPFTAPCQDLFLLRNGETLPQNGILLWESVFFSPYTEKYDFKENSFVDLKGENYKLTSYTMVGYGILENLELLVQVPVIKNVSTQNGETNSSAGIGDISLQTRLMINDGHERGPAFNIGLILGFPTGNDGAKPPLGDGSIDFGFSTVFTKKIGFFTGHIKLGYIFNGTDPSATDLGDKFMYMLKGDFTVLRGDYVLMKEFALMLGLSGNMEFDDIDSTGSHVNDSHQYRPLNIVPMICWTPTKGLFIRPRAMIPIKPLSEGGKYYAVQYILDIKYSF